MAQAPENIPLNKRSYKVILCGCAEVGKTSIYTRLKDGIFEDVDSKTVIPDQCVINFMTNNNVPIKVTLWDTAGMEKFESVSRSYLSDSNLVLIVYSTDKKDSLNQALKYKEEASNHAIGAHIFLVQNKIDLNGTDLEVVPEQEVKSFQKNFNLKLSFKISASTGEGIEEMKNKLAAHLYKYEKKSKRKQRETVDINSPQSTQKKNCCSRQ